MVVKNGFIGAVLNLEGVDDEIGPEQDYFMSVKEWGFS